VPNAPSGGSNACSVFLADGGGGAFAAGSGSGAFVVGAMGGSGGVPLPAVSSGRARAVSVSGTDGDNLFAAVKAGADWVATVAGAESDGGVFAAVSAGGVSAIFGVGDGVASEGEASRDAISVDDIGVASNGFKLAGSGLAGSGIGIETVGAPASCVHWAGGGGIVAGVPGDSVGVVSGAIVALVLDGAVTGRGTRATSIDSDLGNVTTRVSGRGRNKLIRFRVPRGGVRYGAGAVIGIGAGACNREAGGRLPGIARPEPRPAAFEYGPTPSITLRSTITLERGSLVVCARTTPASSPAEATMAISVRARSMRYEHRSTGIDAKLASKRGDFMVARITK